MILTGQNNDKKTPFIYIHQDNPNNDSTAHSVQI